MHREDLVVEVRVQEAILRTRKLQTHREGLEPPEDEKTKRRHDVSLADRLVVRAREKAQETGSFAPGPGELRALLFGASQIRLLLDRKAYRGRAHRRLLR